MQFGRSHKVASYLMVLAAFIAMVGGGMVSPVATFGGVIGLALSWFSEAPRVRFERWQLAWSIASVLALVYLAFIGIATGDYLGAGAQFLTWLVIVKACNRRSSRDYLQLYLLAFLMLVVGSVLNAELTYGLAFLLFVITSTWALALFHLRREMEDNLLVKHAADQASHRVEIGRILASRRIVSGRFFLGTGLLSLGVFALSSVIFLAIPRVGMGFFIKGRSGHSMAGFSDGVKLGGHGTIKDDDTVVMRVELPSKFGGRSAPALHWRGVAFDQYQGGEWSRSRNAPLTIAALETLSARRERRTLRPSLGAGVEGARGELVKQTVWLEPLDNDVLFAAGRPRVFEVDLPPRRVRPPTPRNDEVRLYHQSAIAYTAWSEFTPPPAEALQVAGDELPRGYDVFLQLPPEITPRTRALAAEITAGLSNDYDRARAIEAWLETNLSYSLTMKSPGEQEPVDFFLFDRKVGHCEYFASAFAVLARAVDVPTRSVNGFLGGEWNEYDSYVAVRAGDAHSWSEVYFPGHGWVTFDATPGSAGDQLGRGGGGVLDRIRRFIDTLKFQWTKWVIEYDLMAQLAFFKSIGRAIKQAAIAVREAGATAWRALVSMWWLVVPFAAVAGWWLVRRARRNHREDGPRSPGGRRPKRGQVATAYREAARAMGRLGLARQDAMTPREWLDDDRVRMAPPAQALRELTDLLYAVEFGGASDRAHADRAHALARDIGQAVTQSLRPT